MKRGRPKKCRFFTKIITNKVEYNIMKIKYIRINWNEDPWFLVYVKSCKKQGKEYSIRKFVYTFNDIKKLFNG